MQPRDDTYITETLEPEVRRFLQEVQDITNQLLNWKKAA
jgi:hypothetical protein